MKDVCKDCGKNVGEGNLNGYGICSPCRDTKHYDLCVICNDYRPVDKKGRCEEHKGVRVQTCHDCGSVFVFDEFADKPNYCENCQY